jgi:hypothetical protein
LQSKSENVANLPAGILGEQLVGDGTDERVTVGIPGPSRYGERHRGEDQQEPKQEGHGRSPRYRGGMAKRSYYARLQTIGTAPIDQVLAGRALTTRMSW